MTRTRQETLGMRWNKGVLTVEDGWCSLTWGKLKQQNDRLPNLPRGGGPRQASGFGAAARLTRPITSDKWVLC